MFYVDYDTEKSVMRTFGAQQRSTLIAFKGKTETSRSVDETDPEPIAALLRSTLK